MIPRICIQPSISSGTPTPVLWSEIEQAMRDPRIQDICDQIKLLDGQDPDELARLKRQLPVITPHACRFTGDGKRKSANAVPSGLVMLDIDHIDNPRDIFSCNIFPKLQNTSPSRSRELIAAEVVENKVVEVVDLNNPRIFFVAITPSGHGLRIIAERQENESLIAAQTRLADLCGFAEYDAVTHDLARASFLMPWSYVLYCEPKGLDFADEEDWMTTTESFDNDNTNNLRGSSINDNIDNLRGSSINDNTDNLRGSSINDNIDNLRGSSINDNIDNLRGSSINDNIDNLRGNQLPAALKENTPCRSRDVDSSGMLSKLSSNNNSSLSSNTTLVVVSEYKGIPYEAIVKELVQLLGGEPSIGERNQFYFTLVRYVRYICDFNAEMCVRVLPDFGLSHQERLTTATSSVNRPRKGDMPDLLNRAITTAQLAKLGDEAKGDEAKGTDMALPPLPRVLELICRRLPADYRPAMVVAALPILGALATRIRFQYLDKQAHSFSFMSCITAPAATGKSFIRKPINLLLTPIDQQDEIERQKEEEYKEALRAAKNSKMQPTNPRPCPRNNGINVSIAKLLQLLSYSDGKHLIGIGEEIDTLVKSERAGVWSQKSDIYRLGFDNAKYGQNYMSDNSFSANVPVYYNLLLTGTPGGMYRFFKDVEDGLVTRFCFAQLPDMFGSDIPSFENYTPAEEREIIEIATCLDQAEGFIACSHVGNRIRRWLNDKRELAIREDSRAIDTLRKRSAVIGYRAGMLAYLLNGQKYDKGVGEFTTWVAEYIFQNQMQLFGNKFEEVAQSHIIANERRGSVISLLSELPATFTRTELIALRSRRGQSTQVACVLSRWRTAGFITQTAKNTYRKTPKAMQG